MDNTDTKGWFRPQILLAVASLVFIGLALASSPAGPAALNSAHSLITPGESQRPNTPVIITPATNFSEKPQKSKPMLALSFDDGPNPLTTPLILNTLEEEHVHASFFIVGSRVKGSEKILQRMYRDGDDIGNHSWNHPDFINLDEKQIARQIIRTEKAIAAAGVPAPYMFRPPYGDLGEHFPDHLPLAIVLWNIDPEDWADRDTKSLTKRIINQAKPGGIVDMHGIYISTAEAIVPAIKELKKHYRLVTVSELLGIKPGITGKYYGYR